jgi:mannose/fructose/N-acetylgalactosamine-specific phosphotransferase system component IIB
LKLPKILWRIDDRLIHGQVIIGWCGQLPISEMVVCDDDIASVEWEKNLLLMAAPPDIPTEILTVKETVNKIPTWNENKKSVLILIKSPVELEKLIQTGAEINSVNIGGIHFKPDRKEYLPYVYLSNFEVELFNKLSQKDIKFECKDLPNSPPHNLKKLIRKKNA